MVPDRAHILENHRKVEKNHKQVKFISSKKLLLTFFTDEVYIHIIYDTYGISFY